MIGMEDFDIPRHPLEKEPRFMNLSRGAKLTLILLAAFWLLLELS